MGADGFCSRQAQVAVHTQEKAGLAWYTPLHSQPSAGSENDADTQVPSACGKNKLLIMEGGI